MPARILSLGRDPTIVRARNAALEDDGHLVTSATRVEEALSLVATQKFDLAIVGYTFNRGEKRQLVSEIRAAGIPVLLLYLHHPDPAIVATEHLNIFDGTDRFLATVRTMLPRAAGSLEIVNYRFAPEDSSQGTAGTQGPCRDFLVSVKGYKPDAAAVRNFRLRVSTPSSIAAAMRDGSRYCFYQNLLVVEQYDANLVLEAIKHEIEALPLYACEVESFSPEEKPGAENAKSSATAQRDS
jgi:CheY-like chemotaxis protein